MANRLLPSGTSSTMWSIDATSDNPPNNQLPAGLSEAQLKIAVERSGYPLQTVVAALLRDRGWAVSEEWAFTDSESQQVRTLDIAASRRLYPDERSHFRVRPEVHLLVECKRSDLPYVFFLGEPPAMPQSAFRVAGLKHDHVEVTTDDEPGTWSFPILSALGLESDPFLVSPPHVALSFSKAARKGGGDVVLSGTDAYQGLVLPITKALVDFFRKTEPISTFRYFDIQLPVAVAVLDAPMVAAATSSSANHYELAPWIRVYRHDTLDADHPWKRDRIFAIDVVHASWLDTYLTSHLNPFAARFGDSALDHDEFLASGKAFAAGLGRGGREDIQSRLRGRSASDGARRARTTARVIVQEVGEAARARLRGRRAP